MYLNFIEKKNDFLRAAGRTYDSGIQTGTGGNLSVRLDDHLMIVKPSGFSYGACSEENLTVTDFSGTLVQGNYQPTRESVLHGNLYKNLPKLEGLSMSILHMQFWHPFILIRLSLSRCILH